jgi:hypothetical protein
LPDFTRQTLDQRAAAKHPNQAQQAAAQQPKAASAKEDLQNLLWFARLWAWLG